MCTGQKKRGPNSDLGAHLNRVFKRKEKIDEKTDQKFSELSSVLS